MRVNTRDIIWRARSGKNSKKKVWEKKMKIVSWGVGLVAAATKEVTLSFLFSHEFPAAVKTIRGKTIE